jgi:hypothetical protein
MEEEVLEEEEEAEEEALLQTQFLGHGRRVGQGANHTTFLRIRFYFLETL